MRALGFVLLLAGCANETGSPRTYDNNDLELSVGNAARMGCSCRYVMGLTEAECRAWVKASPDIAFVRFDDVNRRVDASAFISWTGTAKVVDARRGCVLE
ncbi:MAG: hypothetical protein Q8L14_33150 [Myxococcales bacterium]|nr:hypothetical protein [Myxococcales bacterium]